MPHLTRITGVPDRSEIHDGMAYFGNTGPFGTTCGDCAYRGYWRQLRERWSEKTQTYEIQTRFSHGCGKYHAMTGKHGSVVDTAWASCKYFEPIEQGESR